jgi:hypothetical protein
VPTIGFGINASSLIGIKFPRTGSVTLSALEEHQMLGDTLLFRDVVIVGFFILLIYFCTLSFRDLSFYSRNGWNFSQDSGIEIFGRYSEERFSNRERVVIVEPLLIGIVAFFLMMLVFGQ